VKKKTRTPTAKNLQIRLGPQAHEQVKRLAELREKSITDTVREALEVYAINIAYAQKGQPLFWVDAEGNRTMVLIPDFNAPAATIVTPVSDREH